MTRDEAQQFMMAAIDGELDDTQGRQLEAYLETDPDARAELEQMRALAGRVEAVRLAEPPPEVWDRYMDDLRPKLERRAGFGLLAAGLAGLALAFALVFVRTPLVAPGIKLLAGGALAGGAMLFLSVWREKRHVRRHERYGRVKR